MRPPSGARGPRRWRLPLLALTLSVATAGRVLHAQLPAPAVSAPARVHLGGYGSLVVSAPRLGDSTRITESSAALLASGTLTPRFAYFAEFDAVSSTRENYAGRQEDRAFEIARLYAEYSISDAARIRIGRFLTPVGQWNESPAEPLTWTAVRPLTTYRPFAKEETGLLLAGTHDLAGHDAGYALYAGATVGRRDSNEVRFARAVGGRVAMELLPGFWIGASGAAVAEIRPFEAEDDSLEAAGGTETETENEVNDQAARGLAGADVRLQVFGMDLLAEAVSLSSSGGQPGQRGAFAQAALPTGVPNVSLVGRAEWYTPPRGSVVRMGTVGAAYRAPGRLTFKLERQLTDSPSPRVARGWFAAVSLLF